ncbi:hypothetical protein B0H11DRAFT_2103416, partial [Mycena galericulata]
MQSCHDTVPTELEREIFEWTAIAHPTTIPVLLRVARRVRLWVEPYLYRVVKVSSRPPYSIMREDLLRPGPQSKPASFYQKAVRHLYLDQQSEWSPEVLRVCTRTRSFSATGSSSDPSLLPILLEMDLRQLSLSLEHFFDGVGYIEINHPLFTSITHLEIFDDITKSHTQIGQQIASLPTLTHLCLNGRIPADILRAILSECPNLHILVNLWHYYKVTEGRALARNPPLKDSRFVVGIYRDYWREWEASARGDNDCWRAAENFIAQKRCGAIPESRYWLSYWILDGGASDEEVEEEDNL